MSLFDVFILLPLIYGSYRGFRKGLIMELASIIALILALILAFKFMHKGVEFLVPFLENGNSFVPIFAFILIFLAVLLVVFYVSKFLKRVVDFTPLGWVDDIAGGLLGLLKWTLVFSTFLWLFEKGGVLIPQEVVDESILFPYLSLYAPKFLGFVTNLFPFTVDLIDQINDLLNKF
jgi:membrane protein required for colicin V production